MTARRRPQRRRRARRAAPEPVPAPQRRAGWASPRSPSTSCCSSPSPPCSRSAADSSPRRRFHVRQPRGARRPVHPQAFVRLVRALRRHRDHRRDPRRARLLRAARRCSRTASSARSIDSASSVLAQFGGVMLAFAFIATIGTQGTRHDVAHQGQLTGSTSTPTAPLLYTVPGPADPLRLLPGAAHGPDVHARHGGSQGRSGARRPRPSAARAAPTGAASASRSSRRRSSAA